MGYKMRAAMDKAIEGFSFVDCANIMKLLEWRWYDSKTNSPTIGQLRQQADRLFFVLEEEMAKDNCSRDRYTVATGGLYVSAERANVYGHGEDGKEFMFQLEFIPLRGMGSTAWV
jgi:hypothetical protein